MTDSPSSRSSGGSQRQRSRGGGGGRGRKGGGWRGRSRPRGDSGGEPVPDISFELVDTPSALEWLARQLADEPALAIDTEFLPEVGFIPQLCLVQIATGEPDLPVMLVDTLALPDLSPLAPVFADPDLRLVMHNGETDLKLLYHACRKPCRGLFDTQIAAALVGLREQVGLRDLVRDTVGAELPKSQTVTHWDLRPLARAQLVYAAADVAHLLEVARVIEERLAERGREEWAKAEFRRCEDLALIGTPAAVAREQPGSPLRRFRELRRRPKAWKLDGQHLAVLQALCDWREARAQQLDKPVRAVLSDAQMARLAERAPRSEDDLSEMRGLPRRVVEREHEPILAAVNKAYTVPESQWPDPVPPPKLPLGATTVLDVLQVLVKLAAIEHQIAPTVLATRDTLLPLALRPPTTRENLEARTGLGGWRADILAPLILDWFDGRVRLVAKTGAGDSGHDADKHTGQRQSRVEIEHVPEDGDDRDAQPSR